MEQTIAIEKTQQKSLKKSVTKTKKQLRSGRIKIEENVTQKKTTPTIKERGVVYLSNIPHGFYEEQMREYFQQFGIVTNLRLARSKVTGKSKGYAFIEFKEPEVAQIVAETMHNYLMNKRLMKAKYISPKERSGNMFKGQDYTPTEYPKLKHRMKNTASVNSKKTEKKSIKQAKNYLKEINSVKEKLSAVGINYDFKPVDIPTKLNKSKSKGSEKKQNETGKSAGIESNVEESEESDIVFRPPPGVKLIREKSTSTETSPGKKNKRRRGNKKLMGITKKTKEIKPVVTVEKGSKKLKLMQETILSGDQINLKSVSDIKNKRSRNKKGLQKTVKS